MKLQVLQEELTKALAVAGRFVSSRAQLPVLGNVLLQAKKTKLVVSATNLEMSISISLGAKIDHEGEIAIPARVVADLVSNLSPGTLTLAAQKEKLSITTSGFSSTVAAMNTSDFPAVAQGLGADKVILPNQFPQALAKTLFAASTDETRPVLMGVLFVTKGKNLSLVATDGFRLSQKSITLASSAKSNKEQKLILPRASLSELVKLEGELSMQTKPTDNQVIFGGGKTILATRVIEGTFPDYERIIPSQANITVSIDKQELLRAVKLASVFARESANVIKLAISGGGVEISATSAKSGEQKTTIDAKVVGPSLTVSYNYRFLEEFLSSVDGEEVEIKFTDESSPGVFLDPADPDYLHLIMPVKIQS